MRSSRIGVAATAAGAPGPACARPGPQPAPELPASSAARRRRENKSAPVLMQEHGQAAAASHGPGCGVDRTRAARPRDRGPIGHILKLGQRLHARHVQHLHRPARARHQAEDAGPVRGRHGVVQQPDIGVGAGLQPRLQPAAGVRKQAAGGDEAPARRRPQRALLRRASQQPCAARAPRSRALLRPHRNTHAHGGDEQPRKRSNDTWLSVRPPHRPPHRSPAARRRLRTCGAAGTGRPPTPPRR